MNEPIQIKVHPKENLYFVFRILGAVIGYLLLAGMCVALAAGPTAMAFLPLMLYAVLIVLYLFFRHAVMVGYLKGNAIKVSQKQFPEIYSVVIAQCRRLNMQVPDVYVLENGGILNAFATQFVGDKYVVINSDVLDEAYNGNSEAVEFVIGHELGHIKRNHLTKRLLLFPSFIVPFLNRAYSRGC